MENNTIQKLVDITGLTRYHANLKEVLETKATATQAAAEATAAADATSKADAALASAKEYADGLVKDSEGKSLFDTVGSATAAETAAKAYADSLADNYDAAGAAAQALADAKADAASLYQVKGDYEAAGTAAGLNEAMDARVKVLEAIDHEKLASDASAAAVAAIVAGAESDFDTLKEVADWINSDTTGAAALQATVSDHTESITALETDKQDVIEDLATIRSGAAAGATALQEVPDEYVTETELASKGYLTNDNFGFATDADIDNLFA